MHATLNVGSETAYDEDVTEDDEIIDVGYRLQVDSGLSVELSFYEHPEPGTHAKLTLRIEDGDGDLGLFLIIPFYAPGVPDSPVTV